MNKRINEKTELERWQDRHCTTNTTPSLSERGTLVLMHSGKYMWGDEEYLLYVGEQYIGLSMQVLLKKNNYGRAFAWEFNWYIVHVGWASECQYDHKILSTVLDP